ncbi:MAG: protein kinase domain-containing protein [Phycisphaerales bacterium]
MTHSVRQIADSAALIPDADERAAFLDKSCAGDDTLRNEVQKLIQQHRTIPPADEAGVDDRDTTIAADATRPARPSVSEQSGDIIDQYKLLKPLGEGGFGSVWMAEQREPVKRLVALKIIKLGMDTKQVIVRFEMERQALAMMEHPNIARVFDAGVTDTGRPYFVMELCEGESITAYCDRRKLSIDDRLQLMIQICHAVQHAHQKGIIHRDLKPGNVLVVTQDDKPSVKVIDFGIAKGTSGGLTNTTIVTAQDQLIGTPAYISPEHIEGHSGAMDTRSDIYSLGAILYELLTGTPPFSSKELLDAGYAAMEWIIRTVDPVRPSTRFTRDDEPVRSAARDRGETVDHLRARLRGDLDWITMMCLEKDRERRYQSVGDLAADIELHLSSRPVMAGPPSAIYRLRKFTLRNRVPVVSVAIIVFLLIAGLVSTGVGLSWALREKDRANEASAEAMRTAASELDSRRAAEAAAAMTRERLILSEAAALVSVDPSLLALLLRELPDRPMSDPPLDRIRRWLSTIEASVSMRLPESQGADMIREVLPSPDGRLIFAQANDGRLFIFPTGGSESTLLPVIATGWIRHIDWCPDSRRIAAAMNEGSVHVWDTDFPDRSLSLIGHEGAVFSANWSPDGSRIVTAGADGTARVWIADGSADPVVLRAHEDKVYTARWSPDGTRIVTSSEDLSVRMWSLGQPDSPEVLGRHETVSRYIEWSPDGDRILAGSLTRARVWDAQSPGEPVEYFTSAPMLAMSWNPDGTRFAIGGIGGNVQIWDIDTPDSPVELRHHSAPVGSIAWSEDGARLLSASADRSAVIQAADGSGRIVRLIGHSGPVQSAHWIPGCQRVLTRSAHGGVRVWDLNGFSEPTVFRGDDQEVVTMAWNNGGVRLAIATRDGIVRVWDTDSAALPTMLRDAAQNSEVKWKPISGLNWTPDGGRVAAWFPSRIIFLWDTDQPSEPWRTTLTDSALSDKVAFEVHSKNLVLPDSDMIPKIWHAETPINAALAEKLDTSVKSASWSPNGDRIVTAGVMVPPRVWSQDGTEHQIAISSNGSVMVKVAWSPDGTRIAELYQNASVRLWDPDASGESSTIITSPAVRVWDFFWSPSGDSVFTVSDDGVVREWDADGRADPVSHRSHPTGIRSIAVSPDGERLAVAIPGGDVEVWTLRWPDLRARLWQASDDYLRADERERLLGETPETAAAREAADRAWLLNRAKARGTNAAAPIPPR